MVYGRTLDGKVTSFGTTGYTYDNVFLLYDRQSDSVWYPLETDSMTSVGGRLRGQSIPVLDKPKRVPFKSWRRDHPGTLLLLCDDSELDRLPAFDPDPEAK